MCGLTHSEAASPKPLSAVSSRQMARLGHLVRGDEGQDLVEYAFLTLFIAVASLGVLLVLEAAIGTAYSGSARTINDLWVPPEPGAGS